MSLSKPASQAPEVTSALEHGLSKIDTYCQKFSVPQSNTAIAKNFYKKVHNIESLKKLGVSATVAACICIASSFNQHLLLQHVYDELNAPIENILQALWIFTVSSGSNRLEEIPTLMVTFESSSWTNGDTYSIIGNNGSREPKIIKLSLPGCSACTLRGNFDAGTCPDLRALRNCQRDLMLENGNKPVSQSAKKTITLVEEAPAAKGGRPTSKARPHQGNPTKNLEVINSSVMDSASARTMATQNTGPITSKAVPTVHAQPIVKAKKVEHSANATEHEGDWDVIDAVDHDDIEKKWVKLNEQNCGTEKNGRRGWTSGFKKLFG